MSDTASPRLWSWWASPFAGKARAAFAEKGAAFELLEIHPVRRPPRLRELNPSGRVPTLELADGTALRESAVICEWIEETYPEPPLWPADPDLRAWGRGVARWLDDEPTVSLFLSMRKQTMGRDEGDPDDIVERLRARLPGQYATLEGMLALHEGPWLCGEPFTIADLGGLALAVRLPEWTPEHQPDAARFPRTAAWFEALRARPSAAAIDQRGPERLEG